MSVQIVFKFEIKSGDATTPQEIVNTLLKKRAIKNLELFLDPPNPDTLSLLDFGFKEELRKTIRLLEKIKKEDRMIVVYTDYDADGITGGAILWETLHLLGFKTIPYVPHRKLEGYGFSIKGIDSVKKQFDPALIISVDHGITAKEKVTYAKSIGIPTIITDHHLRPEIVPDDAVAIFHIPQLSGSGVAYFFAKAIFEHFSSCLPASQINRLSSHFKIDYLALASIGTIADLVPLTGHSRSIIRYGLAAFLRVNRLGIRHILQEAGISNKPITTYEIGFMIAPRINAIGRLDHAIDALRLLCTTKNDRAAQLASRIGKTNQERQDLVTTSVKEAKEIVQRQTLNVKHKIIILVSNHWHEGIIGLIAAKMVEEYYRPVIVITRNNEAGKIIYKASARSINGFHITKFLRSMKKYLIDVGGHAQAAGFTIEDTKLQTFIKESEKKANNEITDKMLQRKIEVDCKIPLSLLSLFFVKALEKLQPFGIGNLPPIFYSEGIVQDIRFMGKTQNHMKLLVSESESAHLHEFVYFNGVKKLKKKVTHNQKIALIYTLSINRWQDTERVQGIVLHTIVLT